MVNVKQRIKQLWKVDKVVAEIRKEKEAEIKMTSECIRKHRKIMANGVTIKIQKAIHGAR